MRTLCTGNRYRNGGHDTHDNGYRCGDMVTVSHNETMIPYTLFLYMFVIFESGKNGIIIRKNGLRQNKPEK